jgi:hypothetical protein
VLELGITGCCGLGGGGGGGPLATAPGCERDIAWSVSRLVISNSLDVRREGPGDVTWFDKPEEGVSSG